MTRITLDELLDDVKRRLAVKYWNYSFKPDSWFFPSDLSPHNNQFKYRCKKLYEAGMLKRQGSNGDRWGYRYKVKLLEGLEG